jgi:hypothetical protein
MVSVDNVAPVRVKTVASGRVSAGTPPTVRFGKSAPSVTKEAEVIRKRQEELVDKVYYERDGEFITGYDILQAIKSAGIKALANPLISLNPVKWVQMTMAAAQGDGYSQWVRYGVIFKKLPLRFDQRGKMEQMRLEHAIRHALREMTQAQLLEHASTDTHVFEVWRPKASAKEILKRKARFRKNRPIPGVMGVSQALATSRQDQADLKTRFEAQIDALQSQQKKRIVDLEVSLSRYRNHKQQLHELKTTLSEKEKRHAELMVRRKVEEPTPKLQEALLTLEDQIGLLREDIKHKQEMLDTLKLHASVAEALTKKLNQEANACIAKIKETLNRIEVNKINSSILKMSGRLKEKEQLDQELAQQLSDADRAYVTIKTALEADNPETFLATLQQLEPVSPAEPPPVMNDIERDVMKTLLEEQEASERMTQSAGNPSEPDPGPKKSSQKQD